MEPQDIDSQIDVIDRLSSILVPRARRRTAKDPLSLDPDNKLLWRMPLKRLESEIIRDAMLAVSGQLNERLGGAHIPLKNTVAGGLLAIDMEKLGDPADPWRRSIYLGGHRVDAEPRRNPISYFCRFSISPIYTAIVHVEKARTSSSNL